MGGRSCEFIQPGKNIHKCGFRKSLMRHLQMRSRLRDPEQGGSSVRPASVRWASGALRPRRSASSPASRRSLAALSTPKGDPNSRHPPVPSDNAPWLEGEMAIKLHLQPTARRSDHALPPDGARGDRSARRSVSFTTSSQNQRRRCKHLSSRMQGSEPM